MNPRYTDLSPVIQDITELQKRSYLPAPTISFGGPRTIDFLAGGDVATKKINLQRTPELFVKDFTQEFLQGNEVFIEMLLQKRTNKNPNRSTKRSGFIVPPGSATTAWPINFWNRSSLDGSRFYTEHPPKPPVTPSRKGVRIFGLSFEPMNGFYAENGFNEGKPKYINSEGVEIYWNPTNWTIEDYVARSNRLYSQQSTDNYPWQTGGWYREDGDVDPAGIIVEQANERPTRYNHIPVTELNKKIDLGICLNNHLWTQDVLYSNNSGAEQSIQLLIPTKRYRTYWNQNNDSWNQRYPYESNYKPLYIAFRYVVWLPNSNDGRGQIVSGPQSPTIKVRNTIFPFNTDHHQSSIHGKPVCDINNRFQKHDFICNFC
jgi:hypothetical protein